MSSADQTIDDRTPPPGIEVIGELPPGVPWWDADELGLEKSRLQQRIQFGGALTLAVVILVVSPISVLLWPDTHFARELMSEWYYPVLFVLFPGVMFALSARGWWVALQMEHPVRVTSGELIVQLAPGDFSVSMTSVEHRARLVCISNPRVIQDMVVFDYHDNSQRGTPDRANVSQDYFWFPLRKFATLLTYRIAKAKGENPKPPAFS